MLDLSPNGLGAARHLAVSGIAVRAFDSDPAREGFRSRVGRRERCPDPVVRPDDLASFLLEQATAETRPPFLLPCNDKFARFVSERRDELARGFTFVIPPADIYTALLSKDGTAGLATGVGIAVPRGLTIRTGPGAAGALSDGRIPEDFPFPALLKPALSYTLWGVTRGKVVVVRSRRQAGEVLETLPPDTVFLLQEVIPGGDSGLLFYTTYLSPGGRVLAEHLARKLRQYPPGFGTGTLFEPYPDDDLRAHGRRLFSHAGYSGLGMAEFKRDPRDGKLRLIEVNVRLWLFHPLSVPDGVDFVLTAYRDATGQAVPPQVQLGRDVVWRSLLTDLLVFPFYRKRGQVTAGRWLFPGRKRCRFALWDRRDPGPFLYALWTYVGKALRRLSGGRGRAGQGMATAGNRVPELSWEEHARILGGPGVPDQSGVVEQ